LRRLDLRGGSSATVAQQPKNGWRFLMVGERDALLLRGQPPTPTSLDAVNLQTGAIRTIAEWSQKDGPFVPMQIVSGGRAVLGMGTPDPIAPPTLADFNISVVDLETGARRDIATRHGWPHLVGGNTLLMVDPQGRVVTVPVDPDSLELQGVPVPRVEGLSQLQFFVAYDVAADGSLFYVGGDTVAANERTLNWIDRRGQATQISDKANFYDTDSTISSDGRYLAVERSDLNAVWIHDVARDTQTPLWRDVRNSFPVWSPDGARVAVAGFPADGGAGLFVVPADGSADPVRITTAPEGRFHLPMDWSRDGRIIYVDSNNQTRAGADVDLGLVSATAGAEPRPFLQSGAREAEARFSPDGRWIAYESDVTGAAEIFVRAADGTGGAIPISSNGGVRPSWNRQGGELFFMRGRTLMAVDVTTTGRFDAGVARELFTLSNEFQDTQLEPDRTGERFLAVKVRALDGATRLLAIFNWAETLR
jgi:serine/threonine-protein kinase